ncbi:hypothetical protein [Erwinia pyrifoliae]|uniref:hypothetical protein n=1 Tax=Erwinia pyrifoliae TaxID=79967 RepID=UPI00223BD1D2|nr:hypothetical protein [Erwinia pyrifoliae]MCT2385633.1 hypothetical protein [Erwinia pyrifoliae]MCU8588792.1 hypothetical protein [Erwinia pyrifoliae]
MVRNRAAFEALHNKIHGTKIKKSYKEIADFLKKVNYTCENIGLKRCKKYEDSKVIVDNTNLHAVSKENTSDHNMSERMAIANEIYCINKKNFIGESIIRELRNKANSLKWQSEQIKFTISSREKPKKIDVLKNIINDHCTKPVTEKERCEIIMKAAEYYQKLHTKLVSKETTELINRYNQLKSDEKNKEIPMIPNEKGNDLLTEKTVTDNEFRCQEIAQKIFAINEGSLMNRMIETACYDEGIPLNSSPDFIAMRNKEVSGINQVVDSINADQKLRDNGHEDTELALADQVIDLQTATKGIPKLTSDIDEFPAEIQARTKIIMEKAEYYLTKMPHNLDEVSKSLIYEYKYLKVVEAKKTDSQRSENKTDEDSTCTPPLTQASGTSETSGTPEISYSPEQRELTGIKKS